jgi:hypothetical protein
MQTLAQWVWRGTTGESQRAAETQNSIVIQTRSELCGNMNGLIPSVIVEDDRPIKRGREVARLRGWP